MATLFEGIGTFRNPDKDFGWRCRVCKVTTVGYPEPRQAEEAARQHYASILHLSELKNKRDTERLIDTLFALCGIGEQ